MKKLWIILGSIGGVILAVLVFWSRIADLFGSVMNPVCYYGCPNSKKVDKLILKKKTGEQADE